MSAIKSQQRDPWYFSLWFLGLIMRRGCPSFLTAYMGQKRQCRERLGHRGRHTDGTVSWGYGDNWLDSTPYRVWMNTERAAISVNGKTLAVVPAALMRKHQRKTRRRIYWNLVWTVYSLGLLDWMLWFHPALHFLIVWTAVCGLICLLAAMYDWRNEVRVTVNRALLELHQHIVNEARKRERETKSKA